MTREIFESALSSGTLQTKMIGDKGERWYTCRRNGRTKTWKRDSSRFEIPIKWRFMDCARVTNQHFIQGHVDHWFRITEGDR